MAARAARQAWRLPVFTIALVAGLMLAVINIATRARLGLAAMCVLAYVSCFGLWDALRSRAVDREAGSEPRANSPVGRP
jgi:hypothetical protein